MIYLNNAATTCDKPPCVAEAMLRALTAAGSSSRGASEADLDAARIVLGARLALAELFGFSHPERVVLTANATQALNTAILGTVRPGDHVVATAYEHNSVLRPLEHLARTSGVRVDYVPVAPSGAVELDDFARLVTPGTRLVVLSHASNLTGAVLPVAKVARLAHAAGALVLVDAAQTAGAWPVSWDDLGADLLAFTGHKALRGPQGTGGLLVGPHVEVRPLMHGGTGVQSALPHQPDAYPEHLEAGTLNTPGIAGLGAAVRLLCAEDADTSKGMHAVGANMVGAGRVQDAGADSSQCVQVVDNSRPGRAERAEKNDAEQAGGSGARTAGHGGGTGWDGAAGASHAEKGGAAHAKNFFEPAGFLDGVAGAACAGDVPAGVRAAQAHDAALRERFLAGVAALPQVTVYGLEDGLPHVGTVALNVGALDSACVADRLAHGFGIATRAGLHCAPRAHAALGTLQQGAVRFSFSAATTNADIDAAVSALTAIAREA